MSEFLIHLTAGRFTFDLDRFKPNSTLNSAVSQNLQSSAFVRYILREDKTGDLKPNIPRYSAGGFTRRYSSGTERQRSVAWIRNSAKLSLRFTEAPPCESRLFKVLCSYLSDRKGRVPRVSLLDIINLILRAR